MPDNVYPFETEPRRKFDLIWFEDIKPALDAHDFVEDLLGANQLSVVYGESNCGKTFYVLDLSLHLAQGLKWFGKEMSQGGVVYVAMEGGHGIRNRISAFKQHHGLDDARLPLAIIPQTCRLLDPGADTQSLIDSIADAAQRIEGPVKLVVLDTLSRAMAGGNENGPEDMGAIVKHADMIRKMTGSHVMFIHHSGKNALSGARGHSLLRAATDTEIEIFRDHETGISTATVTKQREMENGARYSFKLQAMEVGQTPRGKVVKSCIVEPLEDPVEPRRKTEKPVKMKPQSKILLDTLNNLLVDNGVVPGPIKDIPTNTKCIPAKLLAETYKSRSIAEKSDAAQRQAFKRASDDLIAIGKMRIVGNWVWSVRSSNG